MDSYVIEITTFKLKSNVLRDNFWKEDANIEEMYTRKQPGFISRESGYSDDKDEVVVVVKWESDADALASMHKFMTAENVNNFVDMINPDSMNMTKYLCLNE